MNLQNLQEFLAAPERITTLSTVDASGRPNSAVVGSPVMEQEGQIAIGLGRNRTANNLLQNQRAVLLVLRPGANLLSWQGARVYLELVEREEEGEGLERLILQVQARAGRVAARTICQRAIFRILTMRPLVDLAEVF